jgi:hypothetical protein
MEGGRERGMLGAAGQTRLSHPAVGDESGRVFQSAQSMAWRTQTHRVRFTALDSERNWRVVL